MYVFGSLKIGVEKPYKKSIMMNSSVQDGHIPDTRTACVLSCELCSTLCVGCCECSYHTRCLPQFYVYSKCRSHLSL